jgi:DNA-binding transcriptional regulator YhcF (GntR family)
MIDNVKSIELLGSKPRSPSTLIVEHIKSQIGNQKIRPGEKLPPIRELGKIFGVGNYSVRQAFTMLSKEGVIGTVRGLGTFVSDPKAANAASNGHANKTRAFCVASAFHCEDMQIELQHPITLSSMLDECKALNIKGRLLSPNINILSVDEIIEEMEDRCFDGIIWLYPTSEHWPVIDALYKSNKPIAVTCHSQYPVDVPAVQGNEVGAGQKIGRCLEKEGFNKIIILSYEENTGGNISDVRSGLHVGMKIGLLDAYEQAGKAAPELKFIKHSHDNYPEKLEESCKLLDKTTSLIIANTKELRAYIQKDIENVSALLKGHKLIISTSQGDYHKLDELAEKIEFSVLVYPYEKIGRAVIHKLNNGLDGKFEDTITLVNGIFEKFDINRS